MHNCAKDEGWPLGAGLQEQAPNHLKLRWSKARVVSVEEKSRQKTVAGEDQGDERKLAEEALQQERDKPQDALDKVKTLSGLIPICSNCKKILDDKGYWNQIEAYMRDPSEADFPPASDSFHAILNGQI